MVDIGNYPFARRTALRRDHRQVARRHFNDLSGEFPAVGQHIASEQIDPHPLKTVFFAVERHIRDGLLKHGHRMTGLGAPMTVAFVR